MSLHRGSEKSTSATYAGADALAHTIARAAARAMIESEGCSMSPELSEYLLGPAVIDECVSDCITYLDLIGDALVTQDRDGGVVVAFLDNLE